MSQFSQHGHRGRCADLCTGLVKVFAVVALVTIGGLAPVRAQAPAGTVDVSFTNSNLVFATTDFGGTGLADGSVIRVGHFTDGLTTNRLTLENSNDFATLDALFTPLAEGIANAGIRLQNPTVPPLNPAGALAVNAGDIGAAAGSIFMTVQGYSNSYLAEGSQLYVWAFNTNDLNNVSSGEWGIFTSEANALWTLPGEDALDTTVLSGGATLTALRGTIDNIGGFALLNPPAVPEPASAFLAIVSAFLAILPRRRK